MSSRSQPTVWDLERLTKENKMAKLKIQKTGNVDIGYVSQDTLGNIGVVGGANGLGATSGSNTIACLANIEYTTGSYAAGSSYIIAQKGKHKYRVANIATPTRTQTCVLVPLADGNVANLVAGQMAILAKDAANANITLYSITDSTALGFPPDYANVGSQGNLANATSYLVTFDSANASVQPGSVLTIIDVNNF